MTRDDIDSELLAHIAELTAEVDRLTPLFDQTKTDLERTTLDRNYAVLALLHLRNNQAGTGSPEFTTILLWARRIAEEG